MMKKRGIWLFLLVAAGFVLNQQTFAAESKTDANPWDKFSVNLGVFISATDSSVRIGSGLGVDIDVEDLLKLDTETSVFRLDSYWRYTQNRRHRLDFTWFSIRRDGATSVGQNFTIEDPNNPGNTITIPAGTEVTSYFDLDIFRLGYSYSFFQDDRIDLAAQFGLFVMPISAGLSATGFVNGAEAADITAPLPAFGLRIDFALTPKWYLRNGIEVFYLKYDNFEGSLYSGKMAVEYNPWKHVGIGLGFENFRVNLQADGEDYPGIDFRGNLEYNYVGLQLYGRVFF
jgi:hypothetical protein